jgi:uncharacterized protein YcfL
MKKAVLALITIFIATLMVAGCAKHNPVAPSQAPSQGKMSFTLDAADNVVSGKVTITKGAITEVMPIEITNHEGTVSFNSIQVGTWQIRVQLFDANGTELYTGTGSGLVTLNATTIVTIRVNHNTGTLQISVLVPSPVIDDFDNDSSLSSTPGQRDAAWQWNPDVYTLSIVPGFAGDTTPCLQWAYNKPVGEEWAVVQVSGLDNPGKYHDFSTTKNISVKVYGSASLLLKFQDIHQNESDNVSVQTSTNDSGWTTLHWDLSNVNWQQCDPATINEVLLFVQPGQSGVSGTLYLDDLMGDDTVQP